jgi:hypothetical protein
MRVWLPMPISTTGPSVVGQGRGAADLQRHQHPSPSSISPQRKLLLAHGFHLGDATGPISVAAGACEHQVLLGELKRWAENIRSVARRKPDAARILVGGYTALKVETLSPESLAYLLDSLSASQILHALVEYAPHHTHTQLLKRLSARDPRKLKEKTSDTDGIEQDTLQVSQQTIHHKNRPTQNIGLKKPKNGVQLGGGRLVQTGTTLVGIRQRPAHHSPGKGPNDVRG